jgi:hypothetical protein
MSNASGGNLKVRMIIINRLFQSFAELEQAIVAARETLASKKSAPRELVERIRLYEEILAKQRDLATALCGHAALGNWNEVARHVKLINGLSYMIRDDAREIMGGTSREANQEHHEVTYC